MTTGANSLSKDAPKKKGWPRGRKRRLLPKDINAPKGPLSGYVFFMNDQREVVKKANVNAPFPEINKLVAQKWSNLDMTEKQKYLDSADADKERYQREMKEYKKTDAYKRYIKEHKILAMASGKTKKESASLSHKNGVNSIANNALEIPIFTEEFLNHNKVLEGELRQLRKSNIEYEEQNAILQKHIENMRTTVDKLEAETKQQQSNATTLKNHLTTLRRNLAHAFSSISIPGSKETAKEEDIDNYIAKLHMTLTAHPQQYAKIVNNVKQIVNNLPN